MKARRVMACGLYFLYFATRPDVGIVEYFINVIPVIGLFWLAFNPDAIVENPDGTWRLWKK